MFGRCGDDARKILKKDISKKKSLTTVDPIGSEKAAKPKSRSHKKEPGF